MLLTANPTAPDPVGVMATQVDLLLMITKVYAELIFAAT